MNEKAIKALKFVREYLKRPVTLETVIVVAILLWLFP
jgi:ribosomal protein L31E